jgi:hypothetical protein
MAEPHHFEQQAASSLSLVLTDAFAEAPAFAVGVAPSYALEADEEDSLGGFLRDEDMEAGSETPTADTSYIVIEVVLAAEEFAAGVLIVQPRRAVQPEARE